MQRNEVVQLSVPPRVLADPFPHILDYARGKRVLNVGASGGVEHYLPMQRESWLHHRLGKVAAELVGIDIDADSVAFAATKKLSRTQFVDGGYWLSSWRRQL